LKSKRFVKKTKRGAVLTVTAEHYLRKDIWCGYTHCTVCKVTPTHTPHTHHTQSSFGSHPLSRSLIVSSTIGIKSTAHCPLVDHTYLLDLGSHAHCVSTCTASRQNPRNQFLFCP
jgi:hypothetical protein